MAFESSTFVFDKTECAEEFSYPRGSEVTRMNETFRGTVVDHYQQHEDPNNFADSEDHYKVRDEYDDFVYDSHDDSGYELHFQ